MSHRRVIIDTDAGCDDACAITLALNSPVQIVAITTVFGNTSVAQATENVGTILAALDRTDVPIYAGCPVPLLNIHPPEPWTGHGTNGIGGLKPAGAIPKPASSEHAALALLRLSREHPTGTLDLVALGPLTNVALAVRLDPRFASRLRSVVWMGGAVAGRGNYSMSAEFNAFGDPEAAHIVLQALPASRLTLVSWELCVQFALRWDQFDRVTSFDTPASKLIKVTSSAYEIGFRKPDATTPAAAATAAVDGESKATAAPSRLDLLDELAHAPAASCLGGEMYRAASSGKRHHLLSDAIALSASAEGGSGQLVAAIDSYLAQNHSDIALERGSDASAARTPRQRNTSDLAATGAALNSVAAAVAAVHHFHDADAWHREHPALATHPSHPAFALPEEHPSAFLDHARQPVPRVQHVAGYLPCDAYAMAVYLDPSIVTHKQDLFVAIELAGHHSRGFLNVDWYGCRNRRPNARLIHSIKPDALLSMLSAAVRHDRGIRNDGRSVSSGGSGVGASKLLPKRAASVVQAVSASRSWSASLSVADGALSGAGQRALRARL